MNTSCRVCTSPECAQIDSALAQGRSIRELAGHHEFSRGTITRHAAHRHERALTAATATTLLTSPDLTSPQGVADRFRDLATTAGHLGQLAAAIPDPSLVLRALRAEADLLDRIAPRLPAEQAAAERQQQIFNAVGLAARDSLDPEVQQRFAAAVNANLRRQGLVRHEVSA